MPTYQPQLSPWLSLTPTMVAPIWRRTGSPGAAVAGTAAVTRSASRSAHAMQMR